MYRPVHFCLLSPVVRNVSATNDTDSLLIVMTSTFISYEPPLSTHTFTHVHRAPMHARRLTHLVENVTLFY